MRKILLLALFAVFTSLFGLKSQDVINLSTTDKIDEVLTAYTGNNVVLVIPSGYTNPQETNNISIPLLPEGTKITIKGDGSNPTLAIKGFTLPTGLKLSLFKLQDLNVTGYSSDPKLSYVINVSSGVAVTLDEVTFENCNLSTMRSLVRFQDSTTDNQYVQFAKAINITNCIVYNFADYGVVYNNKTGATFGPIIAKNSTFYGFGENVFMCQTNTVSVSISDCTFDSNISNTGKYIVDLNAQKSPITVTNCIFGKSLSAAKSFRTGGTLTFENSYNTTDYSLTAPTATDGITGALISYANASTSLFKTPTVITGSGSTQACTFGDYSIIDGTFAGATNAGDPRWYYVPTSVNGLDANKAVIQIEYFDVLGKQIKHNSTGIVLHRIKYDDGTSSTFKTYIRSEK